jgi:hypothetical protein
MYGDEYRYAIMIKMQQKIMGEKKIEEEKEETNKLMIMILKYNVE